jgi:formylglycine-generating enzyme required for sulfatase activity
MSTNKQRPYAFMQGLPINPPFFINKLLWPFILLSLILALLSCQGGKKRFITLKQAGKKEQKLPMPQIAPCQKAPKGMACIPGGISYVGAHPQDQSASKHERPQRKVFIQTFYIDKYEVTNKDYRECVKAGACKQWYNIKHPLYRDSIGDKQPAVPLTWKKAYDYCKWRGKRLPTEAEWEKVARGGPKNTIYPWGNAKPDCSKASYEKCNLKSNRRIGGEKDIRPTKPVGSYPPGHYGVYDMAGNGYEWVNDWATDCRLGCNNSCGDDCLGINPKGPCSGRYPCGNRRKKILKGGSWWWPASHLRASHRRTEKINTRGHRLSARCAADTPHLTHAPGWMIKTPPKRLAKPNPPTKQQLKIFHNVQSEKLKKPICKRPFKSPKHCKDPVSYVKSNESRLWLFADYMRNLGGGYVGIAADANYTFIALARSRWVWLMDFDINIVNLHRIIKALVLKSKTPKQFVYRFRKYRSTVDLLKKAYAEHPQKKEIIKVFAKYRRKLYPYYYRKMKRKAKAQGFGWLAYRSNYDYIRLLFQQKRISLSQGDLLRKKTLYSIGSAARKLDTIVRIYYPSNAEEFWQFNDNYKQSLFRLPFDEASIAVRTIHEYPWHPSRRRKRGFAGFWHYVIHGAQNYQKKLRLKDYYKVHHWRQERILPTKYRDFSTIHLPTSLPKRVAPAYPK